MQTKVQGETRQTVKKKRRGKGKKEKKGGERAEAGGSAQNRTVADRSGTEDEEDQPTTVERRIYRRQKPRKLRKLNDGGKLEIVQVKTHNSTDYELGAGAVPPGTYCQTPQCHLVKRPRLRGLPD